MKNRENMKEIHLQAEKKGAKLRMTDKKDDRLYDWNYLSFLIDRII